MGTIIDKLKKYTNCPNVYFGIGIAAIYHLKEPDEIKQFFDEYVQLIKCDGEKRKDAEKMALGNLAYFLEQSLCYGLMGIDVGVEPTSPEELKKANRKREGLWLKVLPQLVKDGYVY